MILVFLSSFAVNTSLTAQGIGASDLSVTIGSAGSSFSYPIPGADFEYKFQSALPSIYLLNKYLTFSLRYSIQEADASKDLVKVKMLDGSISGGPVIPIIRPMTEFGLSFYLPLRAILDYRFVNIVDNLQDVVDIDTPNLYFIEPSIGGGLGFGLEPDWLDSRVRFIGSGILAFGVQKELADQFPDNLRLLRKADLDLEVRINNVLGNMGLAFGYSNRSIRWTSEPADEFTDRFEFVTKASRLPKWVSQNMLRVGIVWHERKGR